VCTSLMMRAERLMGLYSGPKSTRVRTCPRRMDTACPRGCSWGEIRGIVFAAASVHKTAETAPSLFPIWLPLCPRWVAPPRGKPWRRTGGHTEGTPPARSRTMGNTTDKIKEGIKNTAGAVKRGAEKAKDAAVRGVDKSKDAAVRTAEKVKDKTERAAEKVKDA